MPASRPDPYKTLGVRPSASDDEVRKAYRRLVQLHHPDHNAGSEESERRFEEVQEAYARVRELRIRDGQRAEPPPPPPADPGMDERLADIERQVRQARAARERAQKDAREAAAEALGRRATDEELGYVSTDDSFSKILSDARDRIADQLSGDGERPVTHRVADLIDELEGFITNRGRRPREP
jgi:curved DNA-binding protein CbpA